MGSGGSRSDVPSIEMLENAEFFLKLVQTHGSPDAVSATLEKAVEGGYSQVVRKCHLKFADGKEVTAIVKIGRNDAVSNTFSKKLGLHREGSLYRYVSALDHHLGDA